jgi:hypothetical protein
VAAVPIAAKRGRAAERRGFRPGPFFPPSFTFTTFLHIPFLHCPLPSLSPPSSTFPSVHFHHLPSLHYLPSTSFTIIFLQTLDGSGDQSRSYVSHLFDHHPAYEQHACGGSNDPRISSAVQGSGTKSQVLPFFSFCPRLPFLLSTSPVPFLLGTAIFLRAECLVLEYSD